MPKEPRSAPHIRMTFARSLTSSGVLTARLAAGPDKRVRAGLLETNGAGLRRLLAAGWVEAWQAPRLVRGPMPAWDPSAIWGQFDHGVG